MKWSTVITACCSSLLLLALTTQAAPTARPSGLKAQVDAYRAQHESVIVARLDELARFKSVAADPAGIASAADRLQALLQERGFDTRHSPPAPAPLLLCSALLKSPTPSAP